MRFQEEETYEKLTTYSNNIGLKQENYLSKMTLIIHYNNIGLKQENYLSKITLIIHNVFVSWEKQAYYLNDFFIQIQIFGNIVSLNNESVNKIKKNISIVLMQMKNRNCKILLEIIMIYLLKILKFLEITFITFLYLVSLWFYFG